MNKRTCSKCKTYYEADDLSIYFHKNKSTKLDGFYSICKICKCKYHKENRERDNKRNLEYFKKHEQRLIQIYKEQRLVREYGITILEYEELLKSQNNTCAICKDTYEKLVMDHDHKTGLLRAFLCDMCNKGLGYAKDDTTLLSKVVNYLDGKFLFKWEITHNKKTCKNIKLCSHFRIKYNLTHESYCELFKIQNGMCAICKTVYPGKRLKQLVLDHDHITNLPRGLLCRNCNLLLGHFKDDRKNYK